MGLRLLRISKIRGPATELKSECPKLTLAETKPDHLRKSARPASAREPGHLCHEAGLSFLLRLRACPVQKDDLIQPGSPGSNAEPRAATNYLRHRSRFRRRRPLAPWSGRPAIRRRNKGNDGSGKALPRRAPSLLQRRLHGPETPRASPPSRLRRQE